MLSSLRVSIVGALLLAVAPGRAAAQMQGPPLDPEFQRWIGARASPLPAVDSPYTADGYAFLRPVIGDARVLALGENIHFGHEPLAFRNHAIRFAVTELGFTAVVIESGFTESALIDRWIQGGPGELDSVLSSGISYGFGSLRENRELIAWLRQHNATARHKVHFYGMDQSGVDGDYDGSVAVRAALEYLGGASPAAAASLSEGFAPLADRFTAARYREYSAADRRRLDGVLADLSHALRADSARALGAGQSAEHTLATRNAWAAARDRDACVAAGTEGSRSLAAIQLRDSVMAENALWVLGQAGASGRIVVFAHNGHVMDVPMDFPSMGPPMPMTGRRLRAALGRRLVVVGTAASRYEGMGEVLSDISSFERALDRAAKAPYALDLRTARRIPRVAAMLDRPWITRIHAWLQPFVPARAADVIVALDRVTRTEAARH